MFCDDRAVVGGHNSGGLGFWHSCSRLLSLSVALVVGLGGICRGRGARLIASTAQRILKSFRSYNERVWAVLRRGQYI